ncbi:MAG: helix-turn-helix domain-containing protein [Gaiellaceae bacterium]
MNEAKREPTETLGERLRRLRKERGLSQQSISGPGLTTAHISRIEAGLRRPSVRAIRALAKKLDVTPEYLETGRQLGPRGDLELRIADAELELRIGTSPEANADALRSLISEARVLGDPLITARAVAALGVALSATSSYAEAIPLLEEATASVTITPALRPDVYLALARAHSAAGHVTESIRVLEASLEFVREHASEYVGAHMRFAIHLSYALTDAGSFEEARTVLEKATKEHGDDSDRRTQVSNYWTLARIAAMSGETPAALDHMRRAIALLEADEDSLALAKAEGAYGQILVLDGRFEEAQAPLGNCVAALERAGRSDDLGLFVTDQAICAAELGNADEAERLANKALGLLEQSPREQGGAVGALALVRISRNDATGAEPLFARAVDLLEEDSQFEEAGRFCRAWASMLDEQDRRDEAIKLVVRAEELEKRARPHSLRPSS